MAAVAFGSSQEAEPADEHIASTRLRHLTLLFLLAAVALAAATALCSCSESFSIKGSWKNTGTTSWGQMQQGAIVSFDGTHCNVFSPYDTYTLTEDGGSYRLDVTGVLTGNASFAVNVQDADHITLTYGSTTVELTRAG